MTVVWLLFLTLVSYSKSSFLNTDEFKFGLYDVMIENKPIIKTQTLPPFTVSLFSKYGQEYWCNLPNETDILRSQKFAEDASTKTPPNNTEIQSALSPLRDGPCLTQNRGWWTYQLCHGGYIGQFHMDESKEANVMTFLGYYESDYDWSKSDPKDEERQLRQHSQLYVNGTLCDLNEKPRRAIVRYRCSPGLTERLVNVEEPESCVYVLTVETYRICIHPWLKEIAKPPPMELKCVPVLSSSQFQQYRLKEETKQHKLRENQRRASFHKVKKLATKLQQEYARAHILSGRTYRRRDWQQRAIIQPLRQFWDHLEQRLTNIQFISTEQVAAAEQELAANIHKDNLIDQNKGRGAEIDQLEKLVKELKRISPSHPSIEKHMATVSNFRNAGLLLHLNRDVSAALQRFQALDGSSKLKLREAVYVYGSDPLYILTNGMDLPDYVVEYMKEELKLSTRVTELSSEVAKSSREDVELFSAGQSAQPLNNQSPMSVSEEIKEKEKKYRGIISEIEKLTLAREDLIKNLQEKTKISLSLKRNQLLSGSLLSPDETFGPPPPPKWRSKATQPEEDVSDQADLFDELLNHKLFSSLPQTWHKSLRDKLNSLAHLANEKISSKLEEGGTKVSSLGKMQIHLLQEDGEGFNLQNILQSYDGQVEDNSLKEKDPGSSSQVTDAKKSESDTSKESSNTPGVIKLVFYRTEFNPIDQQKQTANEAAYGFSVKDSSDDEK